MRRSQQYGNATFAAMQRCEMNTTVIRNHRARYCLFEFGIVRAGECARGFCLPLFLFLLFAASPEAGGAEIYVSPNGNDANSGNKAGPLASIAAARDAAREYAGKEAVTVHISDGIYYLPETLFFTPEDSGTKQHPVLYAAETEGGAVLSGGSELRLSWQAHDDGIFKAQTPAGLQIDQLFIDGQNQRMARYPNYDASKKAEPYQGFAADAFSKERAAKWADPTGGYIHAMHRAGWGGYHYRITGKTDDGEVNYEGGWQNNRRMGMHKDHRMVENVFEELDAPGEWFHNAKTSTLYYKPGSALRRNSRFGSKTGTSDEVHYVLEPNFQTRASRSFDSGTTLSFRARRKHLLRSSRCRDSRCGTRRAPSWTAKNSCCAATGRFIAAAPSC